MLDRGHRHIGRWWKGFRLGMLGVEREGLTLGLLDFQILHCWAGEFPRVRALVILVWLPAQASLNLPVRLDIL